MKSKLSKLIRRSLRSMGWAIVPAAPLPPLLYPPTKEERNALTRILRQFVSAQDKTDKRISNLSQWQQYLSDQRISFFGEVFALMEQNDVSLDKKAVADFGSGTGYLLRLIEQGSQPSSLVGIDSYPKFNELGKQMCPAADFFKSLHETDRKFDLIFCTEVLEHLTKPQKQMIELYERLQPSGALIFTVPNGRTDTLSAREARTDGTGYWGHVNFWSPESWTVLISDTFPDANLFTGSLPSGGNYAIIKTVS